MRDFCNPNGTRASIVSIQTHHELPHESLSRYPEHLHPAAAAICAARTHPVATAKGRSEAARERKHAPRRERPEGESTRQARSGGGRQCRSFRFGTKYGFIKHCAERPCARNLQAAIDV